MTEERLPDAELEVLACLWQRGEATAREIREIMTPYRPLAHASVMTLLGRLEEKDLIARRKAPVGKAFLYRPTRAPGRTYRRVLGDMVERIFGGDGVAMVASLFQAKPPTSEQLTELEDLLGELKRRQNKKARKR